MTTILVADDEKNIFELTRLYLEKEGYRVGAFCCHLDKGGV